MTSSSFDQILDFPTSPEALPDVIIGWMHVAEESDLAQRVRAGTPILVQPLLQQMLEGDELWICRSRHIGPLAGNRGVAIVRDGQIVTSWTIMHY